MADAQISVPDHREEQQVASADRSCRKIQPIPAVAVKEKKKETRVAKEKTWETKEIPSREQRKDKESIWPIPHPPQRIKRTLPPELTKSPLHRAGMIGKRTAITWIPVGTMPHMTSNSRTLITHMPLKARHGSEGTTPKKKERRTRGSKGRGTDQNPREEHVSNSSESCESQIPHQGKERYYHRLLLNVSILTGALPMSFLTQVALVQWVPAM